LRWEKRGEVMHRRGGGKGVGRGRGVVRKVGLGGWCVDRGGGGKIEKGKPIIPT